MIVTTASIAATDGVDGGVSYSASKGGVLGMTLPLARDLAPWGLRCFYFPGSFATPLVEGMPDEYAEQMAATTPFLLGLVKDPSTPNCVPTSFRTPC